MIDRNNLNRVKGILSARQGAEIPKFQTPAGPLMWNGQGNKEIKFHKKNGHLSIYSNDGANWFQDIGLAIPYRGSLDGYVDSESLEIKPPMEIPGANPAQGNPNATTEAAAVTNAKVEAAKTEQVTQAAAAQAATREPLPELPKVNPPANMPPNLVQTPDTTPKEFSSGMNLTEEEQKTADKNSAKLKAMNATGQATTAIFQAAGQAVGAKQAATDSSTTKTADTVYDGVAGGLKNAGGIAGVVGTAMEMAGVAGDLIQEMGGGTDQQTKMDKWMDSSFFSWNIGMLNGFAGKNSDSFGADQNILASVGSSYGGTTSDILDAAEKADKKYGLFSSKARKKTNAAIATAKSQQNLMGDISDSATDQRLAVQSMGEQAGLAYSLMTDGGYSQKYTYAAKQGGMLEWNPVIEVEWEPVVEINWELPVFKEGGSVEIVEELEWIPEFQPGGKISFNEWFNSIPENYRAKGYDYQKAYEVFDWEELRKHAENPDKNHLRSASPVADENGNYPFLKLGKLEENPEIQGEFDWYNSNDGKEHKANFDIQYIGDRYYYVPKKFKDGGKTKEFDIPEIEETSQKNVIPEGALHKNKHHMEHAEGLTKKGIPVIDEDGEQQAEIEHSEIIFTLEVTKKLEEYYEIFYSDDSTNKEKEQAALEAGKLLVYQILENTEDRTGLIDSCKKGGTLTLKKSTDDIIEEVLEWMPTIVVIEEEEKPKDKKLSEKEQMKEAIKEVLIELLTK